MKVSGHQSQQKQVMKRVLAIVSIFLFSFTFNTVGQKVCKTDFSFGMNSSTPKGSETYWEAPRPNNLIFNAAKSWDSNQHRISLRKQLGANLQYSNIRYGRGNLTESYTFKGNNLSLFANTALLAHFRITGKLAFSAGPEVEILLIGINNLKKSPYTTFTSPPSSEIIRERGMNRDYFNEPSFGIKACLFETDINEKTTLGINFSYLRTKSDYSNFFASNYTRISFLVGFKHKGSIPKNKIE